MSSKLEFASTQQIFENQENSPLENVISMPTTDKLWATGSNDDSKLTECIIISAFTDVNWIKNSIKDLLNKKKAGRRTLVQIILDRGASKYDVDKQVHKHLNLLANKIGKEFKKNSGIFLLSCGGLFHSKMIYSESKKQIKVILGSINFTQRAFEDNEEIALVETYEKPSDEATSAHCPVVFTPMLSYAQNLANKGIQIPIREKTRTYGTMRSRLLDGYLFRKSNIADQFTFHLNFSKDLLKRLSQSNIDETNDTTNSELNLYLGDSKENSISIKKLLKNETTNQRILQMDDIDEDGLTKKDRSTLKNYSLETAFGYWVPREYYKKVNDSINYSTKRKKDDLEDSILMLKNCINDIKDGFEKFIGIVDDTLKQTQTSQTIITDNQAIETAKERWKQWLAKLQKKFALTSCSNENEKESEKSAAQILKEKLSKNLFGYPVPDFWNDISAANEFEDSVIDYIEYAIGKVGKKSTIIKDLCRDINQINNNDDEEKITQALKNHLFVTPQN